MVTRGRPAPALRFLSIITLLNWGCYTWRPEPLVPRAAHEARVSVLRVLLADSSQFVLYDARVGLDSVTGFRSAERSSRTAISLGHIRALEVQHLHGVKTVALGLGVAAGIGAVVLLIAVSQIECPC